MRTRSLHAVAERVAADWEALGLTVDARRAPDPASSSTTGSGRATSRPPSSISSIGLDPDLYPLLASTQTRTGGSNLAGLQDPTLDRLLVGRPEPGDAEAAEGRLRGSPDAAGAAAYLLPLAFRDELVVVRDVARGTRIRPVGDPGGPVLGCANMAPRHDR